MLRMSAMIDPTKHKPIERFEGLAAVYDRHRPDYPKLAIQYILSRTEMKAGGLLVDVGCGTGISSRLVASVGLQVIGVEPNSDMRQQAERASCSAAIAPVYRGGSAEATGLPDNFADCVLAAQAFHWFSPAAALSEFIRILKPGGWIVLIWNEPDRADAATGEYMRIQELHSPEPEIAKRVQSRTGDVLLTWPGLEHAGLVEFAHSQKLDREGLRGRALSASYAPKSADARSTLCDELDRLFDRFQIDNRVELQYRTPVYSAQKPGARG
jgi:ubiquinone/menaquinone biosynthesis C-methylase UbiE